MTQPTYKDLYDKIDKIYVALVGDEKLGIKGTNQRLQDTQEQVSGHEVRITKLEDHNKKNRWFKLGASWAAGLGSGLAVGSGKASMLITKIVTAAGSIIFVCYLLMIIIP